MLLDVVTGNLDGAKNHLGAAMREGLTTAQLAEACMQVMAVCGITTWGQTGRKLCDYAAGLERRGDPSSRSKDTVAKRRKASGKSRAGQVAKA